MKMIYNHLLRYLFVCSVRGHQFMYFTPNGTKVCLRCTALYRGDAAH